MHGNPDADTRPRQYASAADGQKVLGSKYDYWTAKVGDLSFQASFALVAANWAVFAPNIKSSVLSVLSVLIAVLAAVVSLIGAARLAKLHYEQFYSAENDREKWQQGWAASERSKSQWPFNEDIINAGATLGVARVWLPIASAVLFALAIVSSWTAPSLRAECAGEKSVATASRAELPPHKCK